MVTRRAELSEVQLLKMKLLAEGMAITPQAAQRLNDLTTSSEWSSDDYASTSGLILKLEDEVWVNAPVHRYNPNFVPSRASIRLDVVEDGFVIVGDEFETTAAYCPQPRYHGTANAFGPLNNFVFTHGDRVRLSPLRGCAMQCEFCNIPYDDPISVYSLKPISGCLEALRVALADPVQPAHHVLVSGGTPKPKDVGFLRELYRRVLDSLPGVDVDIMMVPLPGVLDLHELAAHGVHELSINIEVYSRVRAREVARQKYSQGLDFYLNFIEQAVEVLGQGRVRSMLMIGLEPVEDTLAGVEALAQRGAIPVLSPFRPDPVTPLRDLKPPSFEDMYEVHARAREIVAAHGLVLGPTCPPCSHNTLSFAEDGQGLVRYPYPEPRVLR